jgi:hypothetical protein
MSCKLCPTISYLQQISVCKLILRSYVFGLATKLSPRYKITSNKKLGRKLPSNKITHLRWLGGLPAGS